MLLLFFILDCTNVVKRNELYVGIVYLLFLPLIMTLMLPGALFNLPTTNDEAVKYMLLQIALPILTLVPVYILILIGCSRIGKKPLSDNNSSLNFKAKSNKRTCSLGIISSAISISMGAVCLFFAVKAIISGITAGTEIFGFGTQAVYNIGFTIIWFVLLTVITFGVALIFITALITIVAVSAFGEMLLFSVISMYYLIPFCALHIITAIFGYISLVRLKKANIISIKKAVLLGIVIMIPIANIFAFVNMRRLSDELA